MKYYRRDWLNKKQGTAFVESTAHEYYPTPKNRPGHVSASLTIADCSRQIHLDFDAFDKEDVDERIYKIWMLRTHLYEIEQQLLNARPNLLTRKQCAALDKKDALNII